MFFLADCPKRHGPPTLALSLSLSLAWLHSAGRSTTQEESQRGQKPREGREQRAGREPRGREPRGRGGAAFSREPHGGTRPSHPAEEARNRRGKVRGWGGGRGSPCTHVHLGEGREGERVMEEGPPEEETGNKKDFPLVV